MEWLNLLKEKRKLKKLLEIEQMNASNAFVRWDDMLYKKSKIKVLEANTSEELSQKWEKFYYSIKDGRGRLGSLWSIDDKKFSVNNDKHYLMIEYRDFSLRDGFSNEEYAVAIAEYDRISARVEVLKQRILQPKLHKMIAVIKDVKCPCCGEITSTRSEVNDLEDDTRGIVTCEVNSCEFYIIEYSDCTTLLERR